ncbi:sigma-70 family RNA polymerase sigma factor [Parafrigoribacterium soli]|uniref:sigma-70 family RNA polymerase sigma factor n=1 Tax=Parafrigoribacterium soli TaxID=3144663 RepID=UPI0032ED93FA
MTMPNLGVLYLEHGEKMIRIAAAVLRREFGLTDGERDVVQEVFRELQEKPPKEEIREWEAFLVRVTQRRAIDWGRKQHLDKRGRSFDDDDNRAEPVDPLGEHAIEMVEEAVDLAARIPDLLDAMPLLTENERYVILQQEFDGTSRDKLATELGVTPPRISQLRTSGLNKLRAHLESEGAL